MRKTLLFILATHNLRINIKKVVALYLLLAINFTALSQVVSQLDEVAKWNFISANVTVNGSATTVEDESGSGFIGTLMNDARLRTIGSTTKYNVLDLGNGTGYFDMGTGIGKDIYTLSNYTMSAFFRVNTTNTDLASTGNCLWNFSNSSDASTDKNGYIFGSLRNQNQHITSGFWATGEQIIGADVYPPIPAIKNGWHHMAYTQNGNIGTIYIDGVKKSSGSITNLPSIVLPKTGFEGTPFNWIGRSCYPGDAYLKKTLVYGFSLYRAALTADNMINYLNVPTIISDLNNAYVQDSGSAILNSIPAAAGSIFGLQTVSLGQDSVIYTVPTIDNASSYIWSLPAGVTGTSTTNSIKVNYTKTAVSGNITVKGHNQWGDGTASTLAITVNQLPVIAVSDTAKNCVDTLILSAALVYPVKISIDTLYSRPDNIEIAIYGEDSATIVSHFNKYVEAKTDTTIYLKASQYYMVVIGGGASLTSPQPSGENIKLEAGGWRRMVPFRALPFKVIEKSIVCEGQALLNANVYYTGTGKLRYKWTPSIGLDNDTIARPKATVSSNATYTVTVTSPNGCTATCAVNVIVASLSANAGIDKTVVCGGSVQLNSVSTNYIGTEKLRYKWTPSTGLNNDTIVNPKATLTSDLTYTVTVTAPSGYTATDNVNVNVAPLSVNAGVDKTVVCGGSVVLNNIITNYSGVGKLRYKWTPSTGLNNDSIANPTATVITNTTYTVTVTTPNGCTASDNISVGVIPMAKPEIGIVGVSSDNKNRVAWNKSVSTGIASYNIYKETTVSDVYEKVGSVSYDSLSVFVDNQSSPDVKSNKYKLSILDRNGVESPQSNSHKTMHLSINKGQNNTWNLIWEPYEGFAVSTYNIYRGTSPTSLNFIDATSGSSTQYSDLSASAGDVYYQLEVISPTLVSPSKVHSSIQKSKETESASSSVLVSYNSSRSNIASNVLNGISNLEGDQTIRIYPNPVKTELRIDCVGGSTFEILNLMGMVVYNGNLTESNVVNTSELSSGVYFVKVKKGNSVGIKKFIKE